MKDLPDDFDDGYSSMSVEIEDVDFPSEVEESVDVLECYDGSIAKILGGRDVLNNLVGLGEGQHLCKGRDSIMGTDLNFGM